MKASARGQDLNETALRLRGDEEDRMWSVRRAIETSRQDPKRILLKTNILPLQDNVVRRLCVDEPKGILRQGARVKICPWKDKYLPKGVITGQRATITRFAPGKRIRIRWDSTREDIEAPHGFLLIARPILPNEIDARSEVRALVDSKRGRFKKGDLGVC
mmetsp:Transcript_7819/g.19157  ORF Transcript_7819/g.19157 Transcript_7819/m.19157 type:complete len:160 (+) Transcript_7819:919-1398(+)